MCKKQLFDLKFFPCPCPNFALALCATAAIFLLSTSSLLAQVVPATPGKIPESLRVSVPPVLPPAPPVAPVTPAPVAPAKNEQPKPSYPLPERAMEILDFWFGPLSDTSYFPEDKMEMWLDTNPSVDRQLWENFAQDVMKARNGDYNSWRQTPRGRLALIILLDFIPRHIYRGTPQAFRSDPMARALALEAIKKGDDRALFPIERALLYVPLEHSENLADQNLSVASYTRLLAGSPPALQPVMRDFLSFAMMRQQEIARYGRFPGRDRALRR